VVRLLPFQREGVAWMIRQETDTMFQGGMYMLSLSVLGFFLSSSSSSVFSLFYDLIILFFLSFLI
jgi:hypothetical protein